MPVVAGREGARPGQNRDKLLAAISRSLTGSEGESSVCVWLLLALGTIIAAAGLGTSAESGSLTREETLAGIQALWDMHVQELPRSVARQIGAIYARYSTKGQISVLDQVRTCLEFATKERIHVPLECIFFDLGVSGRKSRRAGYEALQECLAKKQVQTLLVFTTNRLHRRANRALDFVEMLVKERRMRVVFVMNGIDSQNDSRWKSFLQFLSLFDEFAAEMYVENIRASHIGKLLGRLVHGTIAFGYHGVEVPGAVSRKGKPQRMIEINPDEATVVRRVFDAFVLQGLSIKRIIQQLNADPNLPRPPKGGGQWTRLAVKTLLTNERYRGLWSYGNKESVLLPIKDYIRQMEREEPLKTVQFEELRIISDELFFRAQRRLAELRPEGGRTPKQENNERLPLILNGLFWCPLHEHYLTVGGSKGKYLVCSACEREPLERKHLVSQLNRATALKQLCAVLGKAIATDEGLIERIVDHCRRGAEELQVPDPSRHEGLKDRHQRLKRSLRVLASQLPDSDAAEEELKAALREKRSDLAAVETELAQIDIAASTVVRVPMPEEVQTQLRTLAEKLLQVATEGAPAEIDALKELLKRLTGGKIELHQCGVPKPRRGWLEGRFHAPLVQILSEAVSGATLPSSETSIEIRVVFRRESTDADRVQQAWDLYQQGRMQKEIAEELDCSRSNMTRLLKKAAGLHGVPFRDGRKHRSTLPRKLEQTPAYVELGDRAVELWDLGKSYREIGRECDCSDTTAEKAIRHWHVSRGLPVPTPQTRRDEQRTAAERLHGAGLSWDAIARQFKQRFAIGATNLRSDAYIQRSQYLSSDRTPRPIRAGRSVLSLSYRHTNPRAHFEDGSATSSGKFRKLALSSLCVTSASSAQNGSRPSHCMKGFLGIVFVRFDAQRKFPSASLRGTKYSWSSVRLIVIRRPPAIETVAMRPSLQSGKTAAGRPAVVPAADQSRRRRSRGPASANAANSPGPARRPRTARYTGKERVPDSFPWI